MAAANEKRGLPPRGSVFRHYKNGKLYRRLFAVGEHPSGYVRQQSAVFLSATCTTDGDEDGATVLIFSGPHGLWSQLLYPAVVYVGQDTLQVFIRRATDWSEVGVNEVEGIVPRYIEVLEMEEQ